MLVRSGRLEEAVPVEAADIPSGEDSGASWFVRHGSGLEWVRKIKRRKIVSTS